MTAQAGDVVAVEVRRIGAAHHGATQLLQGFEHDLGVVGVEQVVDGGGALAQRCEQQHAVGDAFGAGQLHFTIGALQCGDVKKSGGEHDLLCF
ncbi:hypothetical protein D3C72_2201420 [compost metagenome]